MVNLSFLFQFHNIILRERKVKSKAEKLGLEGVIPAKANSDFRFLPGFAGFPHFIDAAPPHRSDLLPPDPARHFPLEGKTRKVGTMQNF